MRKGEEGRKSGKGRGRERRARDGTDGGRQRMTWDCNMWRTPIVKVDRSTQCGPTW